MRRRSLSVRRRDRQGPGWEAAAVPSEGGRDGVLAYAGAFGAVPSGDQPMKLVPPLSERGLGPRSHASPRSESGGEPRRGLAEPQRHGPLSPSTFGPASFGPSPLLADVHAALSAPLDHAITELERLTGGMNGES